MAAEYVVRPTRPEDRDAVLGCVRLAFADGDGGGQDEVDIVTAVWDRGPDAVAVDLVAVEEGAVVGHVLASVGRLGDRPVPGLAPLAVRPDHQGRGIGSALVRSLLDRLGSDGHGLVVVLGDPAYYGRFGFEPADRSGAHYRPAGPDSPHFLLRRLTPPGPTTAPPGSGARPPATGAYVYSWESTPPLSPVGDEAPAGG